MFDGRRRTLVFSERELERNFISVVITVGDNCLDTREREREREKTHTHAHTNFSMSRKNNRQDNGRGISFLILKKREKLKRGRERRRMSRCFLDRRRECSWLFLLIGISDWTRPSLLRWHREVAWPCSCLYPMSGRLQQPAFPCRWSNLYWHCDLRCEYASGIWVRNYPEIYKQCRLWRRSYDVMSNPWGLDLFPLNRHSRWR